MIKKEFFKTPIWVENKPEYLKSLTKASDKYIKEARKSKDVKEYIKHYGDFGNIGNDGNCWESWEFLEISGGLGIFEIL